ncbi:hypothetical protein ARAM_006177 [Aspergillus rambellii]|uniref:Nuclear distribution protein nudF n=1 Tax=Aspergillus rambellii TaxID=308745 RepID=A0A0F8WZE2_9EURO|nr:hypothetical protein ARAM_006177 [Aspergillus rambellii]
MGKFLTPKQTDELHKSIVAYLLSMNAVQSVAAITEELQFTEVPDQAFRQKYVGALERKWSAISRIQKRVLDLEAENLTLRENAHSTAVTSRSKQVQDPVNWLPGRSATHTLQSHRSGVTCTAFHPVFTVLASGSEDCTVKIWDWELGQMERTLKGHTRAVSGVDFGGQPDHVVLASCSSDLTIKIWDPNKDYANTRTLSGHDHTVSTVRFLTPTGNILASASRDASIRLWDVSTGYCIKTVQSDGAWIQDISPSYDGRWLVTGGRNQTATIWDVSSGKAIANLFGHDNHLECCAFAPPASYPYLATLAGQRKSVGERVEFVATGSRDKTIKLWSSRGRLVKTLVGHDNWVRGLVFHPGGKYLISVGDDKTVRCWDLSQEGRLVKTIEGVHGHFVSCIRWVSIIPKSCQQTVQSPSRTTRKDIPLPDFRCVFATGSADSCVRVFM